MMMTFDSALGNVSLLPETFSLLVAVWIWSVGSGWFFLLLARTPCLPVALPPGPLFWGEIQPFRSALSIHKGSNTPFSFNGRHLIRGSVATF